MNHFLREIFEQPQALRDTLRFYTHEEGKELLKNVVNIFRKKQIGTIIFTGMGSSFFTSYAASCLLSEYGINSYVINSSELLHYQKSILSKNNLLVCVSQSGESYEVVELLKKLHDGIPCVGVSNEELSTLAKNANAVLLSKAGLEEMTSTKTFVATILLMLILSWTLAGKWNQSKIDEVQHMITKFEILLQRHSEWTDRIVEFIDDFNFIQIIGRGPSYASALQGALMFKEAARSPAEGILGGEFRHGPMEMVHDGFKSIVFAPLGKTFEQSIKMTQDIAEFDGKVVLITNSDKKFTNKKIQTVYIPKMEENLFPIPGIVPIQMIVNNWALNNGIDPGYFTRGAKVTVNE